jgi:antitoxin component of RelBE/YafQ-DinJ toxin-antitoxin module
MSEGTIIRIPIDKEAKGTLQRIAETYNLTVSQLLMKLVHAGITREIERRKQPFSLCPFGAASSHGIVLLIPK